MFKRYKQASKKQPHPKFDVLKVDSILLDLVMLSAPLNEKISKLKDDSHEISKSIRVLQKYVQEYYDVVGASRVKKSGKRKNKSIPFWK